mgnify:FL=1|nr:zinc ribbon domain-containing protein [uncultured Treponema sp.]
MTEEKKKAKYFCEGCGSEVASNAKFCPKCGKFFAAVRCPNCGHIGTVKVFLHGCPSCHYAMSHEEIYGVPEAKTLDGRKHKLSGKSKRMIKFAFKKHEHKGFSDDVPPWLFLGSIVVLVAICVVFFKRCTS